MAKGVTKGRVDEFGRECSKCGVYKAWDEYSPSMPRQINGRQSVCKTCHNAYARSMNDPEYKRRAYLAHRFGITIEIYQLLEFSQQGKCALCLQPEVRVNNKSGLVQPLSIDHAHDCPDHHPRFACDKCIRGLLCDHCNLLIGKVEQREFLVKRFADYLEGRPLLVLQEIYDRDLATVADAFWSLVNDGD